MEPIKKIQLTDDVYVDVVYDEDSESPRAWDNISKLCIREHRRYNFPNELEINFDDLSSEDAYETDDNGDTIETLRQHELKKFDGYHVFWLDCYEHSGIAFSLSGEGMQCQFDTARKCGFIAVPKFYDGGETTIEEARDDARLDIQEYNQYLNGEVYGFELYKTFAPIEQDGKTYTAEPELLDSCYGFYDKEEIAEHIPEEYREKFLKEI